MKAKIKSNGHDNTKWDILMPYGYINQLPPGRPRKQHFKSFYVKFICKLKTIIDLKFYNIPYDFKPKDKRHGK